MKRKTCVGLIMLVIVACWSLVAFAGAEGKLPSKSDKSCMKCHEYEKQSGIFAGKFAGVSNKAKTIQLKINKEQEIIYWDDSTKLLNAETLKKIKTGESVKVAYAKKNGRNYAVEVEVKKGLAVPEEQLASVEEVAKLVEMGPEKGKYVLIDSRPPVRYDEGHIPTAKKLPFFAFDKLAEKVLPKDKEILQIYYCGGFT